VKKICVLCGRGGQGRGRPGGRILAGRGIMVVFVFKFWAQSCMAIYNLTLLLEYKEFFVPHSGKLSSLVWRVVWGGRRRGEKKETSKLHAFST
jgi:hypothetical protein